MNDYQSMNPEEESGLIPDEVHIFDGEWFYGNDCLMVATRVNGSNGPLKLSFQDWIILSADQVKGILPVLAFFAAVGRLPRRLESVEESDFHHDPYNKGAH